MLKYLRFQNIFDNYIIGMKEDQQKIDSQKIDEFIRCIQALNFIEMKLFLTQYGKRIVNCLQSRTRMPSLYYAINITDQRISIAVIKQLVNYGASLYFRDLFGNGYLHYACNSQKMSIFKFLLSKKLSINETNVFEQSILFSIAKNNSLDLIRYLSQIQQKSMNTINIVNVNQQDRLGRTALFYAAEKGHLQMCEILLKMGTHANTTDYDGHTARYYAKRLQRVQVYHLLQKYRKKQKPEQPSQQLYTFNLYCLSPSFHPSQLSIDQVLQFLQSRSSLKELFLNPEMIEQQSSCQEDSINSWQDKAEEMIKLCLQQEGGQFFQLPVDEEMFGINDYYQRIKRPMDFSTIRCKLAYNGYANRQQFVKDVELIFDNCIQYNGTDHYISELAEQLRKYFKQICNFEQK